MIIINDINDINDINISTMSAAPIGCRGCPLSPLQPMEGPGRGAAKPPRLRPVCRGRRHRSPRTGICSLIDLNKELVNGGPGAARTHGHTDAHGHTDTHTHTPGSARRPPLSPRNSHSAQRSAHRRIPRSCPPFNSHDIFISLLAFSRRIWRLRWVVRLPFFFFPSPFPSSPPPPPSPPSLQEMMANRDLK